MKYAIVGGDMRSVLLAEALAADGHRVYCFALEKREVRGAVKCSCLMSCLDGADSVVLPIPAEKDGKLNAPLSDGVKIQAEEICSCLIPGQKLSGGGIGEKLSSLAETVGVHVFDLMKDEEFVTRNAALTAEGAVGLLIHDCDRAVSGSRTLVLGYGRVGKALVPRLSVLGAEVSVGRRGKSPSAEAAQSGFRTVGLTELESLMDGFDFIINTIPARILSSSALCSAAEDAVLMELASSPGGFDAEFARNIGLQTISAPGLPGRFSPRSSAQYIKEYLYASAANAGKE